MNILKITVLLVALLLFTLSALVINSNRTQPEHPVVIFVLCVSMALLCTVN